MKELPNLPESWLLTTFEDVCDFHAGFGFPTEMQGRKGQALPFYKVRDVSIAWNAQSISLLETENSLSHDEAGFIKAKSVPKGVVIFAKIGEALRLNRRAVTPKPSLIDNNLMGISAPISLLADRYLYWYSTKTRFDVNARASVVPSIRKSDVGNLPFPLAPIKEQTRIVTKLEELLSDLDAGVAELKAAQKKLAQYRQSLLKAAVEDSGCGNSAYSKHPLGTLVTAIGQGWSPKCDREPAQEDDQWAVMKTTAIQPLEFDGAHNKALPVELKPREHLELKPGDLLVTRAGPRNRVGITCLVKKTRSKLILCDKAYRIQCDQTRISPDFLELVLNAPHMLQKIDELKTGISDSGLNLTQDRFFSLEIPLPSLQKQLSIVEAVSTQFKLIQAQEKAIERSLQQSTAQRKNILQAAFCGQLVPQDPADEPASVLLKRIRAERAAREAVGGHGRGKKKEAV